MKRLVDGYAARLEIRCPTRSRRGRRLVPLAEALRAGHFPQADAEQAAARRRLVFDDFLLLQLGWRSAVSAQGRERGVALSPPGRARPAPSRVAAVPLDGAQERVWREIRDGHGGAIPDEPAAPGRRGLGQDGGGRARRS